MPVRVSTSSPSSAGSLADWSLVLMLVLLIGAIVALMIATA